MTAVGSRNADALHGSCLCTVDYVGTPDEQRTLNRECPVHGPAAFERMVARAARHTAPPAPAGGARPGRWVRVAEPESVALFVHGYLEGVASVGGQVDPLDMLRAIDELGRPRRTHEALGVARSAVRRSEPPTVGELMDVHGEKCARCDRRLGFRNTRSADAPVVHHVRGGDFRLWCLRCERESVSAEGLGVHPSVRDRDHIGAVAAGVKNGEPQRGADGEADNPAGGEGERHEGSALFVAGPLGDGLVEGHLVQRSRDDGLDVPVDVLVGEQVPASVVDQRDGHESSPRSSGLDAASVEGPDPVSAAAPGAGGPAGGGLQSGGHSSPAVDGLVGPGVMLRCGQCPSNIALAADPAALVAQRVHDAYLRHSRVCMGQGVRG